jgi:uncharacterized protein (DUF1778 family)
MPLTRDRIVVFRLSQDEYRSLQEACTKEGGRSISDFTRSELLAAIHHKQMSAALLDRRVAEIHRSMQRVLRLLDSPPSDPAPSKTDSEENS